MSNGAPQNTIIGGATLWVLRDRPRAEYAGVAKFFAFLSKPEVQAAWHQNTGYLPITRAAFDLTRAQGFYDRNPGAAISIEQMTLKPPTENSKGIRLGSFVLIRDVIEEELEQAFSGKKSAQAALDLAVERGNRLLRQFERANPDRELRHDVIERRAKRIATARFPDFEAFRPGAPTVAHGCRWRRHRAQPRLDAGCAACFHDRHQSRRRSRRRSDPEDFPADVRGQFVSERGSLAQLARPAALSRFPKSCSKASATAGPISSSRAWPASRLGGLAGAAGRSERARAGPDRRDHRRSAARSARRAFAHRAALGAFHRAGKSMDAGRGTRVSACRKNFSMGWTTFCARPPR